MEKEKKIRDKFLESLELPPIAVGDCASIELSGNTGAVIEGCRGVIEYSEEKIALNTGRVTTAFFGIELEIYSFDGENILLGGTFSSIEFS